MIVQAAPPDPVSKNSRLSCRTIRASSNKPQRTKEPGSKYHFDPISLSYTP
jgi:hypothetical protein